MQAKLFELAPSSSSENILSKDGSAFYFPDMFDQKNSEQLFNRLATSLDWKSDELMMFGKKIITQRKVAWIGDPDCSYTYSGVKKDPQAWTPELLIIKNKAQALSQWQFNSCLLNLYHSGDEGMGWHSDDEKELDCAAPIVSISLGEVRKFAFRHRHDKTVHSLMLENGSALVMHAPAQTYWHHSLLKTKRAAGARINLTFRVIKNKRHLP
ncbi:MAG: alpha-ketoglutarate-dependent dioxygenase AlkB [Sheuella sp.]|nr:alpha-ketoglutarate-dependent dioxygenase AlkB [Sheuella sp.]